MAQSDGAIEYTDRISAKREDSSNELAPSTVPVEYTDCFSAEG